MMSYWATNINKFTLVKLIKLSWLFSVYHRGNIRWIFYGIMVLLHSAMESCSTRMPKFLVLLFIVNPSSACSGKSLFLDVSDRSPPASCKSQYWIFVYLYTPIHHTCYGQVPGLNAQYLYTPDKTPVMFHVVLSFIKKKCFASFQSC